MTPERFDTIYKEYHRRMIAFAITLLPNDSVVEDIVSDAFIRLWLGKNANNPEVYLVTAIKHLAFNYLKHKKRITEHHKLILQESPEYIEALETRSELIEVIVKEIKSLPDGQQKVAKLLCMGYHPPEISKMLDLSQDTIRNQVMKVRNKLRLKFNP